MPRLHTPEIVTEGVREHRAVQAWLQFQSESWEPGSLEVLQRGTHSACMGFKNPFVFTQQSRDGNRLWRREREVVEYPPIGRALVTFPPCGVQSLCERLTCGGILILTQTQEFIDADFPGQSESLRTQANPFAGNPLALIIVITNAEMFLKVLLCVFEIVLRLCRDHGEHSVTRTRQRSVSPTQTLNDPALVATLAAVLVERNQSL